MAGEDRQLDRLTAIEPRLRAAAALVAAELTKQFEDAAAANSAEIYSRRLGFASENGELAADGARWPTAPIKYVLDVDHHLGNIRPIIPHFSGVRSAFEIGVGPGYLMRWLIDAYGMEITGCDVELEERGVYRALRRELQVADRVCEHWVRKGEDLPIPKGTEAVIAFSPVYDQGWTPDDHLRFFRLLASHGVDRLYLRLNRHHREIRPFIVEQSAGPVRELRKAFRVVDLRPFS